MLVSGSDINQVLSWTRTTILCSIHPGGAFNTNYCLSLYIIESYVCFFVFFFKSCFRAHIKNTRLCTAKIANHNYCLPTQLLLKSKILSIVHHSLQITHPTLHIIQHIPKLSDHQSLI